MVEREADTDWIPRHAHLMGGSGATSASLDMYRCRIRIFDKHLCRVDVNQTRSIIDLLQQITDEREFS